MKNLKAKIRQRQRIVRFNFLCKFFNKECLVEDIIVMQKSPRKTFAAHFVADDVVFAQSKC